MEPINEVRLDKWLWAVRIYKTRSLATQACRAGHVKPAQNVRINQVITARTGDITRTVKVTGLIENRVGPKIVGQFIDDQTPPAEFEKRRERVLHTPIFRPKGKGRPTKKERRALTAWDSE
jgi:ribosome-associated heat shock protein Hsp15